MCEVDAFSGLRDLELSRVVGSSVRVRSFFQFRSIVGPAVGEKVCGAVRGVPINPLLRLKSGALW